VIGGFYIGKRYCILHELGNKKENLVEFNLVDFHNSPNRQKNSMPNFHLTWYQLQIGMYIFGKMLTTYHHIASMYQFAINAYVPICKNA